MMNSNLEEKFKNAFENYELPYNPQSWSDLNQKLDHNQTTPPPSKSTSLKWFGGAAIILAITSLVIYLNQKDVAPSNQQTVHLTDNQTKQADNQETASSTTESTQKKQQELENTVAPNKQDVQNTTTTFHSTPSNGNSTNELKQHQSTTSTDVQVANNNINPLDKFENNIQNQEQQNTNVSIIFPKINKLCQFEQLKIENENDQEILIVSPVGKQTMIAGHATKQIDLSNAGVYFLQIDGQKRVFQVLEAPQIDFIINEEIQYEKGIPSIPLECYSQGKSFEWSFEGSSIKQTGKHAAAHFYKRGIHDITLSVTNNDGCSNQLVKTVTIEEDYNLLAPTGFVVESADARKNKFIPFALTLRETTFKMMIIDPRTGELIFETESVEGWNGINNNTRELVKKGQVYAWKVILDNPMPGEKKEYSGVITRM